MTDHPARLIEITSCLIEMADNQAFLSVGERAFIEMREKRDALLVRYWRDENESAENSSWSRHVVAVLEDVLLALDQAWNPTLIVGHRINWGEYSKSLIRMDGVGWITLEKRYVGSEWNQRRDGEQLVVEINGKSRRYPRSKAGTFALKKIRSFIAIRYAANLARDNRNRLTKGLDEHLAALVRPFGMRAYGKSATLDTHGLTVQINDDRSFTVEQTAVAIMTEEEVIALLDEKVGRKSKEAQP